MQIPDEVRKCTAFLACLKNSGYENRGTVFFVASPLADCEGAGLLYAVTARHVVEKIKARGDGKVYCRLTTKEHGIQYVEIPASQWFSHNDPRVDVAVASLSLDRAMFDLQFVPLSMFITPEVSVEQEIGIGDDLFFPGLFVQRPGERANLPILRIGNIAAMPEEPIAAQCGMLRPSYLVEARSIGGLSGSPVFWYRGATRLTGRTWNFGPGGFPLFYLLGLVHGHYVGRESAPDATEPTTTDMFDTDAVNMGIAIVIPADDIRATLDHPELRQQREIERERILAIKRISLPVPDVIGSSSVDTNIITQIDTGTRTESEGTVSEIIASDDPADDHKDDETSQ